MTGGQWLVLALLAALVLFLLAVAHWNDELDHQQRQSERQLRRELRRHCGGDEQ